MVNVLNATELFRLKWLILCQMKKVESSDEAVRELGGRDRWRISSRKPARSLDLSWGSGVANEDF